ncbi:MAG: hypothetical protein LBU08_01515 [Tannerellaceae bacterium]|jgi:hypothetical protein|nr:hypothetical protein [Tannerellaceae bacterium]
MKMNTREKRRAYLAAMCADCAKGTYNILFLGSLVAFFLKRDDVTVWDIAIMLGTGALIVILLGSLGYKLTESADE